MPNLIEVSVMGHLGKDPEVKVSGKGSNYCTFSVAANFRDRDGGDVTEWFNVTCFGQSSTYASNYLRKGSAVYISGEMKTREYERKGGTNGKSLDVVANTVKGVGGKTDASSNGQRQPRPAKTEDGVVDDLPF